MDASQLLSKVKDGATRKIGPLPAWAWGVVTAGGIWVWRGFTGRVGGGGSSSKSSTDVGNAGFAVIPSLSGGGAPPPTPAFGSPEGSQSSLYVSTEAFTAEGDPASISGILDQLIASTRAAISTGGNATPIVQPDPVGTPVAGPVSTVTRYMPLSPTNIRALFRDFPYAFQGNPEYWVNAYLGIGVPGSTAARAEEWPNFWSAYSRAGSPS